MLIKRPFKKRSIIGKTKPVLPFRANAMIYGCAPAADNKILDKIGVSSRDFIHGGFVEGDATMYGDMGSSTIPTSADFERDIYCKIPTAQPGTSSGIYGQYVSGDAGRLILYRLASTNTIRFQIGSVTIDYDATAKLDILIKLTIKRVSGVFELLADDVSQGTGGTGAISVYQGDNTYVLSASAIAIKGNALISKINHKDLGELFDFQGSTNIDDDFSIGTLDTKLQWFLTHASWRGQSDAIDSDADLNGYTLSVALGKNLLNEDDYLADTYIDDSPGSEGDFISLAGTRTSSRLICEGGITYTLSGGDRSRWRFEDIDRNNITSAPNNTATIQAPLNAVWMYVYYSTDGTHTNIQVEEGSSPTTFESYQSYYVDSGLTELYPQGFIIPKLEGSNVLCVSYLGTGARAGLQYLGRAKYNIEVLENLISNYDFSNGTTDWIPAASTLSESNNILSVTGDGSALNVAVIQNTSFAVDLVNDYNIQPRVRVTNAVCTKIEVYYDGSTGGTNKLIHTINTPTQDQWYNINIIDTLPADATGNAKIIIFHYYVDAGTANGKVMEIDGDKGVFFFDLDATPSDIQPIKGNGIVFPLSKELIDMLADALPSGIDQTDPDNVIMLPLAVDDLVTENGDQLFFSFDSGALECILAYYNTKTAEEIIRILKYLEMIEPLIDVDNEPVLDVSDEQIYTETEDYR